MSGVVVIETGRILGGDSGYLYIGNIGEKHGESWPVSVTISRHDDRFESIFGEVSDYMLYGTLKPAEGPTDSQVMLLELGRENANPEVLVSLTKAAELP